jgi:predicted peroxiredoxin
MEGEIYFMLDGSYYITKSEFEEGKQFIYSFVENIMSLDLQNVKLSVDVFRSEIIHAISLQNTSNLRYQLGKQ